jgi:hypothetical protein
MDERLCDVLEPTSNADLSLVAQGALGLPW